jgi:predicted CoA-binding protein
MRNVTRDEMVARRVLQGTRTIAAVGLTTRGRAAGVTAVKYLAQAGFDVIPIVAGPSDFLGLRAYDRLDAVPGGIDVVLAFGPAARAVEIIDAAAAIGAESVWLAPGAASRAADARADERGITLVRDLDIAEVHRTTLRRAGQPTTRAPGRGKRTRRGRAAPPPRGGYAEAGGGGRKGGGGGRAALDEKKMRGAGRRRRAA